MADNNQRAVVRGDNHGIIINADNSDISIELQVDNGRLDDIQTLDERVARASWLAVEFLEEQREFLHRLWVEQSPRMAATLAVQLTRHAAALISTSSSSSELHAELLRQYALLAIERTQINTRLFDPRAISAQTLPLLHQVKAVARELQDEPLRLLADFATSNLAYNTGHYEQARQQALCFLPAIQGDAFLGASRTLAISAARVGDKATVDQAIVNLRDGLEKHVNSNNAQAIEALEGISLARCYLGEPVVAVGALEEAQNELGHCDRLGLHLSDCEVLLARTECEITHAHFPSEVDYLHLIAQRGLQISTSSGHDKYTGRFRNWMAMNG